MSGIYFLIARNKIIYIGKSTFLERRIARHSSVKYTQVRVIECQADKLMEYERRLIQYFRPKYNKQHNPNYKFESAPRLPKRIIYA